MKKITTLLVVLAISISGAFAQYYFNTFNPAGMNPGGLNTDPEQPFGATGVTAADGYSAIIAAANPAPAVQWSPNQTIPFNFDFNGSPVTQFKVSNSGVLTFTTSATTVPSTTNATLPNANIPDNSICLWGISQGPGNDAVLMKVHGSAPNRQLWVNFASFSSPTASGQQWTYWGIVLEETTNNIYVVDLRTFNTPIDVTIGIQIDATTAVQVASAPNTPSFVTNGGNASDPSDNVYYEFIQGTRPTEDVEMVSLNVNDVESAANPITISGTISNKGSNPLTSVDIEWTDDNGATVNSETISGINVAPLANYNFSHNTAWSPAAGSTYTLTVTASNPNGVTDPNTLNNSVTQTVFVNNGSGVAKNPLIEEFTTAPCQFCPDGTVIVEQILTANPTAIAVGLHACFGTDAMTIPEAVTYCNAFSGGAPTATIDRTLFPGETGVGHGRGTWANNVTTQLGIISPVTMNVTGTFDSTNSSASIDLSATISDFVPRANDVRVTLFVVEDRVTGTGSGYNQVNFYNTQAGHPYAGAGNPIVGFEHRHVLRDVYPTTDAWGQAGVIPSNPTLNSTYSQNYTFTLDPSWDVNEISLVGFASYFDTDVTRREVLNAFQVKLSNLVATGIEDNNTAVADLSIYPNPTNNMSTIALSLKSQENVSMTLTDVTGKTVTSENFGVLSGSQKLNLDVSGLSEGFYFVTLNVGDELITKKISVIK